MAQYDNTGVPKGTPADNIMEFRVYPVQEKTKGPWRWRLERLRPALSGGREVTVRTSAEGRKLMNEQIQAAHRQGWVVIASHVDQTGGGFRGVYDKQGRVEQFVIPSVTGDIGPRCSPLTRGVRGEDGTGVVGAGSVSASSRRRTLAARSTWDVLYEAIIEGKVKFTQDGNLTSKAKAPGLPAEAQDFQFCAAKIIAQAQGAKQLGSFPGTFGLPSALLGADAPKQRTEAQVLARVQSWWEKHRASEAPAEKPAGRRKPTDKPPADKPATGRRKPGEKPTLTLVTTLAKQPTPVPPKQPTPKQPTPAPPKQPTPVKVPTPRPPTPRPPTPAPPKQPTPIRVPTGTTPRLPTGNTPPPTHLTGTGRLPTGSGPRVPTPQPAPAAPAQSDAELAKQMAAQMAAALDKMFG